MIHRRTLLVLVTVAAASVGVLSAACDSSDGGGSSSSGTSGGVDSGSDTAPAADSSTPVDSAIAPGSVALADGPCTQDSDCAPSARGTTACFMGGMGGGGGDGGGASTSYCSLKCTPVGQPNTTTCAAPFLELCNMRGYCKLR